MGYTASKDSKRRAQLKQYQDKKKKLQEEMEECDDMIAKLQPLFPVGAIYRRTTTNNLYALVDWNGEIRFLNITNNHFWKEKNFKSRHTQSRRLDRKEKAEYLTYQEMEKIVGSCVSQFKYVASTTDEMLIE